MKTLFLAFISVLLAVPCQAKIITVDDDGSVQFDNIQDAINFASDGDTIVVKPGTYSGNISFNGRAVTVTSEDPNNPGIVQSTTIIINSGHSVIFDFGEDSNSVLTGFTIKGRGIYCYGSSPTIAKNIIEDCSGYGISGQNNAIPTILDNMIRYNSQAGIYQCHGPITNNIISQNSAGIADCNGPIINNFISSNLNYEPGFGGAIHDCNGEITGNMISDNYASFSGGAISDCGGDIKNNVIAGNRAGSSSGGLYNCSGSIYNNTVVGNKAGENGGGLSDCPHLVYNNIITFNRANSTGGIYGQCSNSYNSFWMNQGSNLGGGATVGLGDIVIDPLFAISGYWDANGTPDESDDFWVDGDYHLKSESGRWDSFSQTWLVDNETSSCVDGGDPGSDWTKELWPNGKRINMGAYGGTAEASMSPSYIGNIADLNHDGWIDYSDFALWVNKWLYNEALLAQDLTRDGVVNFEDFAIFGNNWHRSPPIPTPPVPDPMTWTTMPYATSPYSIAMVAATAISTDGSGVEYYFEDYFYPDVNSGWISFGPGEEPLWEVSELLPDTLYWYRVKARNKGNLLETEWSQRHGATTLPEDTTPPTPNPATWQTEPYPTSPTSIRMVATEAYDDSGVEYQFECTSHPAHSSEWQDSPVYEANSLPKGIYTFVARARDKSPNQNPTAHSVPVTIDLQPPTPDPMRWAEDGEPKEVDHGGDFNYWAEMTAAEATDESGGVEYFFVCEDSRFSSKEWQSSPSYSTKVGRAGLRLRFSVKARDIYYNETKPSSPPLPTR